MVGTCVENKFVPEKSRKKSVPKKSGNPISKEFGTGKCLGTGLGISDFFTHLEEFPVPQITLLKVKRRCFEVTLRKFQVQIGAQGTDDDVRVKVCCLSFFCHLDSGFP